MNSRRRISQVKNIFTFVPYSEQRLQHGLRSVRPKQAFGTKINMFLKLWDTLRYPAQRFGTETTLFCAKNRFGMMAKRILGLSRPIGVGNATIKRRNSEQRTANSEQRTANSEQRTANSEQRTANSEHIILI